MQEIQSGILIVDKPAGISSAKVVARVKKAVGARKTGHAGTLDPFATGVMVCCINQATRLARFFLHSTKKYRAVIGLGTTTDTQDLTGTVIDHFGPVAFSESRIHTVFKRFEGVSEQHPPVFSALKHKGVPLYKLARRGKPVQKPPRQIEIGRIEIIDIRLPDVCFEVTCSAGTYVRTLCADIGTQLGCGGHLKALRRIESSGFSLTDALTLTQIEALGRSGGIAERLVPMAAALRKMPGYRADESLQKAITTGKPLTSLDIEIAAAPAGNHFVKVVDACGNLLAVLQGRPDSRDLTYCCVFNV